MSTGEKFWARAGRLNFVLAAGLAMLLVSGGTAGAEKISRAQLQVLWGSGAELGSNAPDENDVLTLTFEHFGTWSYGHDYFFFDLTHETDGGNDLDIYGEFYPALSLSKVSGKDIALGPVKDVLPTLGVNAGTDVGIFLPGVEFALDIPGFRMASVYGFAYDTFKDPFGRDLDTTFQFPLVWNLPFTLFSDDFQFSFQGFTDFIGSRGTGQRPRIVSQPQLRLDLGPLIGGAPDQLYVGTELRYFRNKFGVDGVNEFMPQAMIVWIL